MYNCVAVGFESSFLNKQEELSPIGMIQQSANKWVKKYGNPGNLYTPIAIMGDFFSGWSFPRHLYSGNIYRVWGNLPYEQGDYFKDGILNMLYPGYQDASYFHDETGFASPTPYGDAADCILSDCPLWLLQQYPILVIGDQLKGGNEIKDKLEKYIESGGHLIITSGSLKNIPNGLSGITAGQSVQKIEANASVSYNNVLLKESAPFELSDIRSPEWAKVIATCQSKPLVIELTVGEGKITVLASPFGLSSDRLGIPKSQVDSPLKTPFPLLNHVKLVLGDLFHQSEIFEVADDLSIITCWKSKGEFTVAVSNNSWSEKPLQITSRTGKIVNIKELPIDCSEQNAVGFLPKTVINHTGKNNSKTIAGGAIRIFSVKTEDKSIDDIAFIQPKPNPVNRGLTLRNISSIKEEILLRPTFFQHFDRIIIDWKYLFEKEKTVLEAESGWIKRQGLKVIVDFSSGINLFPDLRLINNDSIEFNRSLEVIKSVIDKMGILGAEDLIICAHRSVENNFSEQQFNESIKNTIKEICQYCGKLNINVNFRMTPGRNPGNLEQISSFVSQVNEPNLYVAPVAALLLENTDKFGKNLELLQNFKYRILLVAAPEMDIYGTLWNLNKQITSFPDQLTLKKLLQANPKCALMLDGICNTKDEEYLEIKLVENPGKE